MPGARTLGVEHEVGRPHDMGKRPVGIVLDIGGKKNVPPGRITRASSASVVGETNRRLWWRVFGQGSG
ncbi:hypothetical protein [Devosia aurantiaca]|uniref:hypothetical protein n=1 Tax=Devosia aurantiaca TaxID=2714858 RepID=UPI001F207596|nr:hypothetical protein [Devosia aurantiaca]